MKKSHEERLLSIVTGIIEDSRHDTKFTAEQAVRNIRANGFKISNVRGPNGDKNGRESGKTGTETT